MPFEAESAIKIETIFFRVPGNRSGQSSDYYHVDVYRLTPQRSAVFSDPRNSNSVLLFGSLDVQIAPEICQSGIIFVHAQDQATYEAYLKHKNIINKAGIQAPYTEARIGFSNNPVQNGRG